VAFLAEFGLYLPGRVVANVEIGALAGADPEWIRSVSGIEERRFATAEESVADMAAHAALDCLARARMAPTELGMLLVASGSAERQFPGPAATAAAKLGLDATPALDLPIASAGSLMGLVLASKLVASAGNILVIGAEKLSPVILRQPMDRGVAVLFGDGAGACLVRPDHGKAEVIDSEIHTDGAFAEDLKLEFMKPLEMNGRSVILQASRKIPRSIAALLERNHVQAADVDAFLMHQANRNLTVRVAQALGVPEQKFFTNIERYGNTSSASLLIAAAEWERECGFRAGAPVCLAAFGAGFHWGAMLLRGSATS
jgi:3-oxoacyl-[acyl-carrier-protein] synthase III